MGSNITISPEETKELAKQIAAGLKGGEILGLVGELGSGKTVFVQGLAEALGIKEIVNSPTFVLMKIYKIPFDFAQGRQDTRYTIRELIHIDAYRLESFDQLKEIGAEEYFNRKDCLVVIEWAEKVPALRNYPNYQEINFKEGKQMNERMIEIKSFDKPKNIL